MMYLILNVNTGSFLDKFSAQLLCQRMTIPRINISPIAESRIRIVMADSVHPRDEPNIARFAGMKLEKNS